MTEMDTAIGIAIFAVVFVFAIRADRAIHRSLRRAEQALDEADRQLEEAKAEKASAEADLAAELADSISEGDEPPICQCGTHYVGMACPHDS